MLKIKRNTEVTLIYSKVLSFYVYLIFEWCWSVFSPLSHQQSKKSTQTGQNFSFVIWLVPGQHLLTFWKVYVLLFTAILCVKHQLHELKPNSTFAYILPQVHAYTQVSISKEPNFLFFPKLFRLLILMALKNLHLCYSQ